MGRRARWLPRVPPTEYVFVDDLELDDDLDADAFWPDTPDGSVIGPREMRTFAPSRRGRSRPGSRNGAAPRWKEQVARVRSAMERARDEADTTPWPVGREIVYVLDADATVEHSGLVVELRVRDAGRGTAASRLKPLRLGWNEMGSLPDPGDRQVFALLRAATSAASPWIGHAPYSTVPPACVIPPALWEPALSAMLETGRCGFQVADDAEEPLRLRRDSGDPWTLALEVSRDDAHYLVTGALRRGGERMALDTPVLLLAGGLLFTRECVARFDDRGAFPWIVELRRAGALHVPVADGPALVEAVLALPATPEVDLPDELRYEEARPAPRPRLRVEAGPRQWGPKRLRAALSFEYDGAVVEARDRRRALVERDQRRLVVRDPGAERAAAATLTTLGFRPRRWSDGVGTKVALDLAASKLPRAVKTLVAAGWHVEADGKLYRPAGAIRVEVRSGIDWFELHGTVTFGTAEAPLPALLAALRRGEKMVVLGDGTYGMLPEDWLARYGFLASLGARENGHLRFGRRQVGLLDALLASLPEATCDAAFARAREEIRRFDGIRPADPSADFAGELRGYQRDGLGWFHFLRRFGFGGCLADDMGLGKTVQALALLDARRAERARAEAEGATPAGPRASLVVVPRSLVFNWTAEAARFAPKLRVLDHTRADRRRTGERFEDYDLVLTTYGTLRRDAAALLDARLDYVILDEAQAIKNAGTETAKAARLLQAEHRLALSGTPVQNHLGELWSLFEFLNPGMLGSASAFGPNGATARDPDAPTRALLARALRPFVLRRTKEQVAPELPSRLEQTLWCDLGPEQRVRYDELRHHYRRTLGERVRHGGIARSAVHILEALLRLRQAACHPGLIDRSRAGEPSAKLEVLLSRLAEVAAEGHKALVFSQFTSFLAIVRARLDAERLPYAYLDGATRDRQAHVARFQEDPDCRLFLVSLKAGGLGLNLTAAEYVFLLDPWWNPAVEAQAIDRTHRIGQARPVFAYRLIARDTVEEKVLALQQEKRDLAEAIVTADGSLIRTLRAEDLELLLS